MTLHLSQPHDLSEAEDSKLESATSCLKMMTLKVVSPKLKTKWIRFVHVDFTDTILGTASKTPIELVKLRKDVEDANIVAIGRILP